MNTDYLEAAKAKVPNVPLLINMVSRRVRQLNMGQRPMVRPDNPHQENLDIALKEVAQGLLQAEIVVESDDSAASAQENFLKL